MLALSDLISVIGLCITTFGSGYKMGSNNKSTNRALP
jgi:hypothetical protein